MDADERFRRRLAGVISDSMKNAGMVQRDLAAATGITLPVLNGRLRGSTEFKASELHDIAVALNVTASSIWDASEQVAA